jgi:hypothetical protein
LNDICIDYVNSLNQITDLKKKKKKRYLFSDCAEGGSDYVDLEDFPDGRVRLYLAMFVRVLQLAGIEYRDWIGISRGHMLESISFLNCVKKNLDVVQSYQTLGPMP